MILGMVHSFAAIPKVAKENKMALKQIFEQKKLNAQSGQIVIPNLSYSRRSVSGPLWAFAAAGCIARTTGIAGVCFTAFGLMGFSG